MPTTNERVAVVTGAAQGIGERIAEVLVAEGFAVASYDREACTARADADGFAAIGDVISEPEVAVFADEVVLVVRQAVEE